MGEIACLRKSAINVTYDGIFSTHSGNGYQYTRSVGTTFNLHPYIDIIEGERNTR